jgi:hypothetical protein
MMALSLSLLFDAAAVVEGGNGDRDAADGTSEKYDKQKSAWDCAGLRGAARVIQKLVLREEPGSVSVVLEREYLLSSFKGDMATKSATDKEKCWD